MPRRCLAGGAGRGADAVLRHAARRDDAARGDAPPLKPVFICAHGAGGHKDDRSMLALAAALAPMLEVVRFNFPYREKGSKRPDAMPILQERIRQEAGKAKGTIFLGGRSMGGRAASMLAADGFDCAGLLLFAYPLHPAGQPEKLRTAHLPRIRVPVLCFNGTRDALCDRALMEKSTAGLQGWTQHWLAGARHSFAGEVMDEVARVTAAWLRDCTDIQ